MTVNLECPHCKHDGTRHNPHLLTTNTNLKNDESLVCISEQYFLCGRCRIESPFFVYVRRGDIISHMRDENGETWFPAGVSNDLKSLKK